MDGMMLPSGNDASHALAKYFGDLLVRAEQGSQYGRKRGKEARSTDTSDDEDDEYGAQNEEETATEQKAVGGKTLQLDVDDSTK